MSELKAKDLKDCPFCGKPHENLVPLPHLGLVRRWCELPTCPGSGIVVDPDKWNTRPRERELESQVANLKEQVRIGDEASTFHMQESHKLRMREDELESALKLAKDRLLVGGIGSALDSINSVLGKGGE